MPARMSSGSSPSSPPSKTFSYRLPERTPVRPSANPKPPTPLPEMENPHQITSAESDRIIELARDLKKKNQIRQITGQTLQSGILPLDSAHFLLDYTRR